MDRLLPAVFKCFVFIVGFLCIGPATTAQTVFKEFNINNGLPHTDAYCTVQDSKGFLWFATLDGLCRYDGFDMIVYRNDHSDPFSLTNNRIIALEYDKLRNGLWIGTQGGGLNYMDLVSGKFYQVDLKNNGHRVKEVLVIKIIEGQTLLVGTNEGLYEGVINNIKPYTPTLKKSSVGGGIVESIFNDKNNGVWVGTLTSLYYKPIGSQIFSPIFTNVLQDVNSLVTYDSRNMLAGSPNGLFIVNFENFTVRKLNDLKATSLYVDNAASIWVGTLASGLFNCNGEGSIVDNFSFDPSSTNFRIKNIFKDRSSSLFISTQGEGIKIFNENNYTFKSYPKNVAAAAYSELKRPLCFYADDDSTVLIGTRRSGLAVYERYTDRLKFYNVRSTITDQVTRSNITAVFKDSNKNLWIGDGKGIVMLDGKYVESKAFHSYLFKPLSGFPLPLRVNKILQDKKERVWVVTSRGLFCYDKNSKLVLNSNQLLKNYKSIQSDYLNDIILNEEDNGLSLVLWVASKSGIWRVKLNNTDFTLLDFKKFTAGAAENQLYANWISLLHQDRDQNIWAGTIGGGLSLMVPEKNGNYSFRTITTKNGLLTNDIETLLEDSQGNFWIGSIGLTKYNSKNRTFTYYDDNDGLQSNAFKVWAAFKREGGEMFFGGINGFNIFYPQSIGKKSEVYSPQLTNLVINNINVRPGIPIEGNVILKQSLPYTPEITLNHKIGSFGVEFASIHSHDFQKIVYRYMLKGYDKEWIYT
ncbi:MAG: two-component regulator propeller domain-containing protein, partial [Chitinophagaceae bacterium]